MVGISETSSPRNTTNSINQSITGSQADIKINDIETTTEDTSNSAKTGTIASYNADKTEQKEVFDTDPDTQKALARAIIAHGGSVKLGDTPAQNPSESAQYGA